MRTDPVVIRVWKGDPDDVFALFPTDPADNYGHLCTSYQHVGQHSSADYWPLHPQQPARHPPRSGPAADGTSAIGYRPRVLKRAARRHHDERLSAARGVA